MRVVYCLATLACLPWVISNDARALSGENHAGERHRSEGRPSAVHGELHFDEATLLQRGYSKEIATYFAKESRFLPGTHEVMVSLNGAKPMRMQARFDGDGALCFDASLLVGLHLLQSADPQSAGCSAFLHEYPETQLRLMPGRSRIDLVVPERALAVADRKDDYIRGGWSGLLNYDVFAQRYVGARSRHNLLIARLEPGFNLRNWVVRSEESYYGDGSQARWQHQQAYAMRAIEPIDGLLQVGQIQNRSQTFGGIAMTGVQLYSDGAQAPSTKLLVPIRGVARTAALVEIRQRGQLVYKTLVEPGPFTLTEVGHIVGGADIEVDVVEQDGARNRFIVTAAVEFDAPQEKMTYHLSAGRYRQFASVPGLRPSRSGLMTAEITHSPGRAWRFIHGAALTSGYVGWGTQVGVMPQEAFWMNIRLHMARTVRGVGGEVDVSGSWHLSKRLSVGMATSRRTQNYVPLGSYLQERSDEPRSTRSSYSGSLTYSMPRFGSFSYSRSKNRSYAGLLHIGESLDYNVQLRSINLSLSWNASRSDGRRKNALWFASVSMPLDAGQLSGRVYRRGRHLQQQAEYSRSLNPDLQYRVSASADKARRQLDGGMTARTSYARVQAGLSVSNISKTARLGWAGGWAIGPDAVAHTSGRIGDTFGILRVPDVSGLRIRGGGDTVITDRRGIAVLTALSPFATSRVNVDGRSIPRNYRLKTTATDLAMGYGAVARVDIEAIETRQVLLSIRHPDGRFASVGAAVRGEDGNLLSTVIGKGNVMLVNQDIGRTLSLDGAGGRHCTVRYDVPKRLDPEKSFEEVDAVCE